MSAFDEFVRTYHDAYGVPRVWSGRTVVCIACGPSLTEEQVECVRKARDQDLVRVIVVNNAHELAPWADLLYACDAKWWRHYRPKFAGLRFSMEQVDADLSGVLRMPEWSRNRAGAGKDTDGLSQGLSRDPRMLKTGAHSGYQAINLAYLLGARRIVLLGYDARNGEDGRQHFFGDHRAPQLNVRLSSLHGEWRKRYPALARELAKDGVEVVNCTPGSAIECFERRGLEETLASKPREDVKVEAATQETAVVERKPRVVAVVAESPEGPDFPDISVQQGPMLGLPNNRANNLAWPARDLAWMSICKAANISAKRAYLRADGINPSAQARREKLPYMYIEDIDPSWLVGTLVRNPFERLVSLWTWATKRSPAGLAKFGVREGMEFAEFVTLLARYPDPVADRHFCSQSYQLSIDGELVPNRILRLEDLPRCWERWRQEVAAHCGWAVGSLGHENRGSHRPYREVIGSKDRELIESRWGKDLEVLGYEW